MQAGGAAVMSSLRDWRVLAGLTLAAATVGTVIVATSPMTGTYTGPLPPSFSVGGKTFQITSFAINNAQRAAGLMGRKVTNSTLMLFAWPSPGRYQFWMYDTNTSLDMIWINESGGSGRVVYVVTGAEPCYIAQACTIYTPTVPANYVIEARAGFAVANGIRAGSQVGFG